MSLWLFGDSYADTKVGGLNDWQYQALVSRNLKHNINDFSCSGSALDYTYLKFHEQCSNFNHGDYVIIALTVLQRDYFITDHPELGVGLVPSLNNKAYSIVPGYIQDAIEKYYKYLHNDLIAMNHLVNFLYMVNSIAYQKQLHVLILDGMEKYESGSNTQLQYNKHCYPNLHVAKGQLYSDVSYMEFYLITQAEVFNYYSRDPRSNHMCRCNHEILADKILKYFIDKIPVDLTDGSFKQHIITSENFKDSEFTQKEFTNYV